MSWQLPQTIDDVDRIVDDCVEMESQAYAEQLKSWTDDHVQALLDQIADRIKKHGKPPRFMQRQVDRLRAITY